MTIFSNYIITPSIINDNEPLYITTSGHYERLYKHTIQREQGEIANEGIIIFCLSGEGWIDSTCGYKKVLPGMVLYCDKGVEHAYGSNPDAPWDIYWAHFGGPFTEFFADALQLTNKADAFFINNIISIKPMMQQLLSIISTPLTTATRMEAYSQLRLVLLKVLSLKHSSALHTAENNLFTQSITLMTEHLYGQIDLNTLAGHVNLSKYHYTREFKKIAGVSPMKYYTSLKIEQAKNLLLSTDQTISEISRVLNFSTPFYFSETFKNHTDFSPRAYKQLHQKHF